MRVSHKSRRLRWLKALSATLPVLAVMRGHGADTSGATDPLLDLFIKKGFVTQQEADQVKAEADYMRTNGAPYAMPPVSKWKISNGIQNIELYGDLRLRYEDRTAVDPDGGQIALQRYRYSVRVGLRGDALDDFYYGFRLETSSNPRSPWVTMGTASSVSSSSPAYQGPFGKSTAGINIGQVYLGWHPEDWVDITLGKMPNPLYTTPMVWSANINPEGSAERFRYTVGQADFFATFAQFVYQDMNPVDAAQNLGINNLLGQNQENIFQLAWEAGLTYHITDKVSAKMAATIYEYYGLKRSTLNSGSATSPYYGDPYVGEGDYAGPGSGAPYYGNSGYGAAGSLPGYESLNYPNNQVGLNDLTVLEVPFEVNVKFDHLNARLFGDFAYNLKGAQRAQAASEAYAAFLEDFAGTGNPATIQTFPPQTHDDKAYQIGVGVGSADLVTGPSQGLVYGTSSHKHDWEVRTYWQHIEQYSLDPNLLDTDFMEGDENLQGIYAAVAYALSDNFIATFRYGYASRINSQLGTGGTGQDIPQINPIEHYNILQVDATFRF
ncbi:MAG: putative porin [Verrucomicrobiota bacterium]|jgi:hypothetical protein